MAYSMTGFGRFETSNDSFKLQAEIRSVNHRYLDLNIKLGHRLLPFENKIRSIVRENIKRGKVDVSFILQMNAGTGEDIVYNDALAKMYSESITKIADEFGLVNDLTATRLAGFKDVLSLSEIEFDEDMLWIEVEKALSLALKDINEHRLFEGERLKSDLITKLDTVSKITDEITKRSPMLIEEYKEKLNKRLSEYFEDGRIDPSRIAAEVVIYADRIAIDEELVRLSSHVASFKDTLCGKDEMGRKLDFIAQEMNREANTILSKTQDPEVSDMGIELKTLIEKIREQIQNLE